MDCTQFGSVIIGVFSNKRKWKNNKAMAEWLACSDRKITFALNELLVDLQLSVGIKINLKNYFVV